MTTIQKVLPSLLLLLVALGTSTQELQAQAADCSFTYTFTTDATQAGIANKSGVTPCVNWRVTFSTTGTLSSTVTFQTSPDNTNWTSVPNSICTASTQPPCVLQGINPMVGTQGMLYAAAYGSFVRVITTSSSGTGTGTIRAYGAKGATANSPLTNFPGSIGPTNQVNFPGAVTIGGAAIPGGAPAGSLSVMGDVYASIYHGDGSQLSGIVGAVGPLVIAYTVGTGGTTINDLVKLATDGTVIKVTGTEGVLGIANATKTAGQAVDVTVVGAASCLAEGSITAGHWVVAGTIAPTSCLDSGTALLTVVSPSSFVAGKASASTTNGLTFGLNVIGTYRQGEGIQPISMGGTGSATLAGAGIVLGSSNLTAAGQLVTVSAAGVVTQSTIAAAGIVQGSANLTTAGLPVTVSSAGVVTQTSILGSAVGGTGNGFTKFSGPTTAERTFTLPDASSTIATGTGTLSVVPKWTGTAGTLGDSVIKDDGTAVTITQNSVVPFTIVASGALVNTLYLNAGKVGIGNASPAYSLDVSRGVGLTGTARFFDQTATTGSTLVTITPGAAQTSTSLVLSIGGQTQAADGTASLPAYSFSSRVDTGIYAPSAAVLAITTGSGLRFAIQQSKAALDSTLPLVWGSGSPVQASDTGISRVSAGVIGVGTGAQGSTAGSLRAASYQSAGTTYTLSTNTCSGTSLVGGATAGTFVSGTTGTCTVVITMGSSATAPTGWACTADDRTTPADLIGQTASSATTATLSGTTLTSDVISFSCIGY